jgi:hypothetical protein
VISPLGSVKFDYNGRSDIEKEHSLNVESHMFNFLGTYTGHEVVNSFVRTSSLKGMNTQNGKMKQDSDMPDGGL